MSVYVRYSADNIGDNNPNIINGSNSGSRSSSDDEMQMEHQGRLGTPDANANIIDAGASYLKSSDNFNTKQQQKQQQFLMSACPTLYGASTEDLFSKLHETLALEPKYQPNLFLSPQSNVSYEFIILLIHFLSWLFQVIVNVPFFFSIIVFWFVFFLKKTRQIQKDILKKPHFYLIAYF